MSQPSSLHGSHHSGRTVLVLCFWLAYSAVAVMKWIMLRYALFQNYWKHVESQ